MWAKYFLIKKIFFGVFSISFTKFGTRGKEYRESLEQTLCPDPQVSWVWPPWRAGGLTEVAKGKMPFVICNTLLFWD